MQHPSLSNTVPALVLVALLAGSSLVQADDSPIEPPSGVTVDTPPGAAIAAPTTVGVSNADDASSYSIGLMFGNQLHTSGLDNALAIDAVIRGLREGLTGKMLSPQDKERAVQLMRSGRDAVATRNRAEARDFLAKNSAIVGITSTSTGLQYQIFSAGNAKASSPTLTDRVTVNYRGRLLDGTEFDNSDAHAQAATFGLNGVIKGWREALLLMKPGSEDGGCSCRPSWRTTPTSPPAIPPGSLLIFDVELLKVEKPPVLDAENNEGGTGPRSSAIKPATGNSRSATAAGASH